ncbi:BTB/POZ domain-containing protein FBL11-like isoform X2 [Euphorbia lathyris]|uniref:BTB/POZ domain-containing protein FBL11-like isoform X2 n=1 Tax=Euphorbia lathyris TaxID=212925 RepID=UPI00331391F2
MASSSDEDFVTLSCTQTEPNPIGNNEIFITIKDINSSDLSAILSCKTVKIQAHRDMLVEDSSFFEGLLSGSFRESNLNCVSIEWTIEGFINILRSVYGFPMNSTSGNFLSHVEDALYFGSKSLLSKCKAWLNAVASSNNPELQFDDLIDIWNFCRGHGNDSLPEICALYLARNFMQAISSNFFGAFPYNLLLCCIKHPHLTIQSEMDLSDALLVWLNGNSNREQLELPNEVEDQSKGLLKQIRVCLLPLWYIAGKQRCCYFSELAKESIQKISRLVEISPPYPAGIFEDGSFGHLRIRLTESSKKVNISGCPQVTSDILFLSLLRPEYYVDSTQRNIIQQSLITFDLPSMLQIPSGDLYGLSPSLSFEAVEEVDISKCPRLRLKSSIELFSKSFPSLRKLIASYLLNFMSTNVFILIQKCPLISEIDIAVDVTPLIPEHVTVVCTSVISVSWLGGNDVFDTGFFSPRTCLSRITRLILEGRSDVSDLYLQCITKQCVSLQYLNLKGCISATDIGISVLINGCLKLHSIIVCDTSFGIHSIQALCSPASNIGPSDSESSKRCLSTLAFKLQTLHMGGCKGVDENSLRDLLSKTQTLKRLCLRGTHLIDDALYSFSSSSLEFLDISQTMISGDALAHIVNLNPALKCLNTKDCKNLSQHGSNNSGLADSHRELFSELGKKCKLEKIVLGWGISWLSLEALKPAITSLREIQIGLGGSLNEDALRLLPTTCPMLESVVLYFQMLSDTIVINIMALKHLRALGLCYCFGDISISSFRNCFPNLTKLRLERVAPWVTNNDLDVLILNCVNLVEFALVGCRLLNPDSLRIISNGWPGLTSIHLEDCGEVTQTEVSCLYNCRALEDVLLRHNGKGIHSLFIIVAAKKLPLLRRLSLDTCDAIDGEFEIPDCKQRGMLSTVEITRCFINPEKSYRTEEHKDTLVLEWSGKSCTKTVVEERL